ncbi:MAG: DUF1738 domain-containing protein [Gammaproteobacteria bacterium]|nr:DUF1738 domain-containing protein [Gammaproteobacteria bacterium]MBL4729724.1 DUF1738 domain-containing protein [Gammaproteobacteria bacterium]
MSKSSEKVIELLQKYISEGSLMWHKPYLTASQANAVSKKEYNGINAFITAIVAGMEGYKSPYWGTFKQIRELGGKLIDAKGCGVPILFYKDLEDCEEKKRFVVRHCFVFNFDLVEGVELEPLKAAAENISTDTNAETIAKEYLNRESVNMSVCSSTPSYSPVGDSINMPALGSFVSKEEYYSTLFHELAHSTGHSKRLARFDETATRFDSKEDYSKEELIAEITAALVCHSVGVDSQSSIKNSAAYIQGWSKYITDNTSAFVSAVNHAYKAKNLILS